jgi:Zn-dependent peptidase ImmA (M78 family)
MSGTKEIFGTRLRQAREAAGLSLRKLQERLGKAVTHTQLAKYEKGIDMPSSKTLLALCRVLACTPDQLFRPLYVGVSGIEFRKRKRWPKSKEKALQAKVQNGVDRYFELEELVGIETAALEPVGLRCSEFEAAEAAAEETRRRWGLGENPVSNVVELLEERHVKVQEIDGDEQFDGCSGWGKAGATQFPVIVLSEWLNKDLARKRFTASHELGHLVMDVSGLDDRQTEAACNRFAGAFLLPKEALFSQFGRHRSRVEWPELAMLKREYGISMAAVLHRIKDLGIISDAVSKRMSIERNTRGWRKQEPGEYAGSEECFRFRQILYRGVAEGKISLTKAAELADESVELLQRELDDATGGTA